MGSTTSKSVATRADETDAEDPRVGV